MNVDNLNVLYFLNSWSGVLFNVLLIIGASIDITEHVSNPKNFLWHK